MTLDVKGKGALPTYYVEHCEDSGDEQFAWQPKPPPPLPSEMLIGDLDDEEEGTPTTHLRSGRMAERVILNADGSGARFSRSISRSPKEIQD